METIASNDYYDAFFDKEHKMLEIRWKPAILDLFIDEYKKVLLQAYNLLFDYQPTRLLQNTLNAQYPITPDLQQWITENITKNIFEKTDLKKVSYVLPTDILTKFGIEQLVEMAQQESPQIIRMFFDDYQKALDWLIE